MEFNEDIWSHIKCYLFKKHLWTILPYSNYSKVIKSLPKVCYQNDIVYPKTLLVSPPQYEHQFVKIYETFMWMEKNNCFLLTYYIHVTPQNSLCQIMNEFKSFAAPIGFYDICAQ